MSSFFTELEWKRISSHSVSFPFYSQQLSFIKWTQRKYKNISFESKQKNTMSSVKQFNKKRTFVFLLKSLQLVVESECLSAGLSVCLSIMWLWYTFVNFFYYYFLSIRNIWNFCCFIYFCLIDSGCTAWSPVEWFIVQ